MARLRLFSALCDAMAALVLAGSIVLPKRVLTHGAYPAMR